MNLQAIKQTFGGGTFLAVSYTTNINLRAEFADREPTSIDKLPPGHYLIIQLSMPPTPESGVYAVPDPRPERRGQTRDALPPTPEATA